MPRRGEVVIKFRTTGVTQTATQINRVADAMERLVQLGPRLQVVALGLKDIAANVAGFALLSRNINNLARSIAGINPNALRALNTSMRQSATSGNILSRAFIGIGNAIDKGTREFGRFTGILGTQFERLSRGTILALRGIGLMVSQFGSAVRMAGQALQNLGTTMTFFLALPLGMVLKRATSEAIAFDDALIKIQKTTGMTDEQLGRMRGQIGLLARDLNSLGTITEEQMSAISTSLDTMSGKLLEMARYSPLPLGDIAALAEEAGRLGIQGSDAIIDFVRASEMIGIATDIAATDAIKVFSKLANATGLLRDEFGELRKDAGDNIMRLASVVNMLENTTMSSASEIVTAMERMIGVAAEFNIPAQSISAFAATLIEAGMNAETAGTTFDRVVSYMVKNSEDLAEAAGISADKFKQAMDDDIVATLMNVLKAFGDMESSVEAAELAFEIFQIRGKRGVALLAESYGRLVDNMNAANKEFARGTSLVDEYYNALDSTKSQMEILQNNLRVAAVILGKSFLPTLTQLAQIAVAVISLLTEQWEKLSGRTKLLAVALALLAVVVPPIALAFGSVLFAGGMLISMIGSIITGLVSMIGVMSNLVVPALAMLTFAMLTVPKEVEKVYLEISAVIQGALNTIANKSATWGENIVLQLARGLINGIKWVIDAAYSVANAIARFFRSFSPPEVGPLSTIDEWGANLMDTLLLGFKLADFDILNDVGGYIRGFFEALDIGGDNVFNAILDARKKVKEFIDYFNRTGKVAQSILNDIGKMFGDVGGAVKRLLILQVQYRQEVQKQAEFEKQLEDLQRRREGIVQTYDDEVDAIAASGKSAIERSRLFREARATRDRDLETIDDEIDATESALDEQERVVDAVKEQLQWQQALLDALLEEARLIKDAAEEEEKRAGSLKDALSGLEDLDLTAPWAGWQAPGTAANNIIEQIDLGIERLRQKLDEAKLAVETFWAALTGQAPPMEALTPQYGGGMQEGIGEPSGAFRTPLLQNAYTFGAQIRDIWDEITGIFEEATGYVESLSDSFGNLLDSVDNQSYQNLPEPIKGVVKWLKELNPLQLILLVTFGAKAAGIFLGLLSILSGVFRPLGWIFRLVGNIIGTIGQLSIWKRLAGGAGTVAKGLAGNLGKVSIALLLLSLAFLAVKNDPEKYKDKLQELLDTIKGSKIDEHGKDIGRLGKKWGELKEEVAPAVEQLKSALGTILSGAVGGMDVVLETVMDNLIASFRNADPLGLAIAIADIVWGALDIAVGLVTFDPERIRGGAEQWWNGVKNVFKTAGKTFIEAGPPAMIGNFVDNIARALGYSGPELYPSVLSFFSNLSGQFESMWGSAWSRLKADPGGTLTHDLNELAGDWEFVFTDIGTRINTAWFNATEDIRLRTEGFTADVNGTWGRWTQWIWDETEGLRTNLNTTFGNIYDEVTGFIDDTVNEAFRIFNEWRTESIDPFLADLQTAFGTVFDAIRGIITRTITAGLNHIIAGAELAINSVAAGINTVIDTFHLPVPHVPIVYLPRVSAPELAEGGIVTSPMAAIIGDVRGGEAVVPLNKLPSLIAESYEDVAPQQVINIRIDRVDASDRDDIEDMVNEIVRRIGRSTVAGARMGTSARL